jgi:hypothetical protein
MIVLVSAIEVGSVRVLIPVCIELVKGGHTVLIERKGHFLTESIKELESSFINLPVGEDNLRRFIQEKGITALLFSVNLHDTRPMDIARIAHSLDVQTIHIIDYWNGYRSRMEIDGLPMFQPTIYMVPDEYARKKAIKEGILSNLIKVVGQPAFAWVEEAFQCASQQKNPLETLSDNYVKTILFVSEPAAHDQGNSLEENPNYRGYTERDAIQILINAIKITDEQYLVAVLPHPRQDVERLKETWKSCGGDLYGSVQDVGLRGRDFLPFVHGVAGMSSTLLYEAWLVGKSVLRIQPGLLNESARNMERKEGIVLINQYANANEKALQWLTELPNFPTQQYQAELKLHKQAPKRIVEEIANLHR